ncbi:MAG: hypothetical protein B6D61_02775 [Bacteroidetes bacterium 4484_249]|nr:MAG: hypothetical protein B6D61_02775 [Bacteroidetes bacterium 4484_249]
MKTIKVLSISVVLTVFFYLQMTAEPVELKTAKQVAINLCSERSGIIAGNLKIIETFIERENPDNIYYIFNFINPEKGFVIVSADDAAVPVLGYSFGQIYEPNGHPVQLDEMLSSYREQILFAIENKIQPTAEVNAEWERLSVKTENFKGSKAQEDVSPLLATKWNQNWPYNELCPADGGGPGGHAYAGCVATAMAQVMKYWSHPTQGTGSHSYNHYIYGNLFADFGATTYDWANMPHSISESNTPIATLMYHCGVAVEMSYGPSGSGATLDGYHGACNALKNYFNYDLSAYHDQKYKYADSVWQNMIRNELDNGRPMLYSGEGDWSGHAWVLDGYEAVNDLYHYHMNWGWGGSYNGYYYLDDLTPGYHNYYTGQEAIFNLFPYSANLISCYPQNSDYWTGTTNTSSKTETSLAIGTDPEDGWMSFDISAIPDGSTIYAVSFNGFVYERFRPNWSITPITSDPVTASASVLHADIVAEQSSGFYFHHDETNITYPIEWRTYMLEGDVCADLQSSLSSDKFSVGIANDYSSYTRYIRFHGWNEANPPFLNIYYTAFGNIEGYVAEHGSSTPIEDVYVSIGHFTDTTDSNGYYFIENVPIGSYLVSVDANGRINANGNPFFNDTITDVISDGITSQVDFGLKWAEIELDPGSMDIPIDPYEIKTESFTITNNGPGDLEYFCHVEPPMGDTLANFDIETASGDIVLYGCEFDGSYVWATGPVSNGGNHQLYKFDKNGTLVSQYPQGTTSAWGMRKMTFDGTYLYSYDDFGFYRINPGDGAVTTLFTDFPEGLYGANGIAWVPGLGFVASYDDEDFFVFDETGALVTRLTNAEEKYYTDLTYDDVNECLWVVSSPNYTIYQYDLETESLTGLSWLLPQLDGDSYQSAYAICFSTEYVENVVTICGMTYGNPLNHFFALEVESWLQITGNRYGTVESSAKGSLEVMLEIDAGELTEPTKTADVVIKHNAGDNSVLTVTITNNYITGSLSGYVTEFGNPNPIQNALLTINGQSDLSGEDGFYQINNIPNGIFDLTISHSDYINETIENVPVTGLPGQQDIELKWTEININPSLFSVNLNPDNTLETNMNIANAGTGDLEYNCEIVFPNKSKSISILVVDRDMSCHYNFEEEYYDEWENYESALDDNNFSYTYHEVYHPWYDGPDLATMQQYDIIIWFTGEAYDQDCMTENDENNLASYLDGGGLLFLSSQGYLVNYGSGNFTLDPGEFPYDYLGLRTVTFGNWYVWFMGIMEGVPGSLAEGYTCNFLNYYYNPPVELSEINDHVGIDLFNLTDPTPEGICAIQYKGNDFKSVFSTLSLASVEETCRANLLADIVEYLSSQWVSIISNGSGIVPCDTKGSVDVGLLFDATGLAEGTYEAEIQVGSNDPDSLITIPVTLNVGDTPEIELKVFLEGPFNGTAMSTDLSILSNFPLSQPYTGSPWNYPGTESVVTLPNNIVDWVLVEFRDAANAASANESTAIDRQAAFLLNNGFVVGLDGVSNLQLSSSVSEQLFVVICHRNHLDILSANPLVLSAGIYTYDFTTGEAQVYGGSSGYKEISQGIWGMAAGDGETNNIVNNGDKNNSWLIQAGLSGYLTGDFNLDCNVGNNDKNDYWLPNIGKGSQMPE